MTDEKTRGPVDVQVRAATAPDGARNVLLQLPDGYVLMSPVDATRIAHLLLMTAAEIVHGGSHN